MQKQFKIAAATAITFAAFIPSVLAGPFSDVNDYHQYANEIDYIKTEGMAGGFSDGSYKPESAITRAEFTKIVINANFNSDEINDCIVEYGYFEREDRSIFPDIDINNEFGSYVCMAKENEIISGFSDGTFRPNDNITFGQSSKVAVRTLDPSQNISADADIWAYINYLQEKGARPETVGMDNNDHVMNRGEVAHVIQRVHSEYSPLASEPQVPKATYNFMIKIRSTHSIPEEGLNFRSSNFGIHCTTSNNTFIDLDVTKNGSTQQVHLERSCTGLSGGDVQGVSTHEADAHGYHYKLVRVHEATAWDVNSFEYYIEVTQN